jgi:TolB protein
MLHRQSFIYRRLWGMVLTLMLATLTGCADPTLAAQWQQVLATGQTAPAGMTPENRLLIQGADGNLFTIHPDGSGRVMITNDATSQRQYLQPTWSPSGRQIAWAEVDNRTQPATSALLISQTEGRAPRRFDTPFAPFYIQWSPDETRLAYLSNWLTVNTPNLALRLVDLNDPAAEIRTLVEGQPLYFTWSPQGDRLLAHVSNERLEFRDLEGVGQPLAPTFATFPAPQWSTDGSTLLYALGEANQQQLVLTDVDGAAQQEVTDYTDAISFSLSPTNDRVAYAITPSGVGAAAFGPLYVTDVDTRRTRELTDTPVLAFFWSPDGSKLAYLALDDNSRDLRLRWYVWDGTRSRGYAQAVPTRTFLQAYVAFFDQYARSMTLWSPDSRAFAYPAVDRVTGSNIYVQALDEDAPTAVARGVFVAWSPR